MRKTPFVAALALTFAAASAGAQQPTTPTTPGTPSSPAPGAPATPSSPDSMMRDSAMRGAPRAGMMQDSMARRGTMRDSMGGTTRGEGMAMRGAGQDSSGLLAQVDSVNAAASAGLTSLAPSAAVALIQSIETQLRASNRAPLRSIATDLAALRRELGASTISGRRVGAILSRVGPKVTRASAGQSGPVRTSLAQLGRQLSAAGRQLSTGRAAAASSSSSR